MKRTASTSPGTAPRTAIGPVRQWPLRLLLTIVGTFSPGNVCGCRCPDAFSERSTIVSPGSTVSTGGRSQENTSTVVDGDGSSWWRVMQRSSPLCSSATMPDRQAAEPATADHCAALTPVVSRNCNTEPGHNWGDL